jgi:hypothetical protein
LALVLTKQHAASGRSGCAPARFLKLVRQRHQNHDRSRRSSKSQSEAVPNDLVFFSPRARLELQASIEAFRASSIGR